MAENKDSEIKLTVGEENVKTTDVTKGDEIDLKHRDPENLHDHVKVGTKQFAFFILIN